MTKPKNLEQLRAEKERAETGRVVVSRFFRTLVCKLWHE